MKKIISISEYNNFITSHRDTFRSIDSYVIPARSGHVVFDFYGHEFSSVILKLKRVSGNGLVRVSSACDTKEFHLPSEIQQVEIISDIVSDKKIKIERCETSTGEISILELTLTNEKKDFSKELEKAVSYSGLTTIEGDLFANYSGAFIKGKVISIETSPSNMFHVFDGNVSFVGHCKIINLKIEESENNQKLEKNLLQRALANPIHTSTPTVAKMIIEQQQKFFPNPVTEVHNILPDITPLIIFDTLNSGFNQVYCIKCATVSNNSVVLNHEGVYTIPLSVLKAGCNVTIAIDVETVDGNGKFGFGILPNESKNDLIKVCGRTKRTFLYETKIISNNNYNITIWRDGSATGRIKISRILIISSNIESNTTQVERSSSSTQTMSMSSSRQITNFISKDPILDKSRHFSILINDNYNIDDKIVIPGKVNLSDYNSKLWYNMMSSCISDFYYTSNTICFHGDNPEKSPSNVNLCSKNFISSHERIYINEFSGKLTNEEISVLSCAKEILSPSLLNIYYLKTLIGESVKLSRVVLPWMFIPGIYKRQEKSFVYYESEPGFTYSILNAWKEEYGKLTVIGSNIKTPKYINNISQYDTYKIISKKIVESSGLIYLNSNQNHDSGIINLARAAGSKIITNNLKYINNDSIIFKNEKDFSFVNSIENKDFSFDSANYNNYVISNLKILVGG